MPTIKTRSYGCVTLSSLKMHGLLTSYWSEKYQSSHVDISSSDNASVINKLAWQMSFVIGSRF